MRTFLFAFALAAAGNAFAQHAHHHNPPQAGGYAGMLDRDIKALSAEQVADLRAGRGMGASLPAELNGVPGPLHVLELSRQLRITPEQRVSLDRITAEMKTAAQALGAEVIAAEAALDRDFKDRTIDEKGIEAAAARIGSLQGRLRAVHLVAHLKTRELLSDQQVMAYNEARGYGAASGHK